jgi:tyrosine-protein kinase Etk/Wzc
MGSESETHDNLIPKQEWSSTVGSVNIYVITRLLLNRWWLILIIALLSGALTAVVVFKMKNEYKSVASAVPPKKLSSSGIEGALGSVSSTLREFGLSKIGKKSSDNYDFLVLLQSRQIKDSLIKKYNLKEAYEITDNNYTNIVNEVAERLECSVEPEGNYTVSYTDTDAKRSSDIANDVILLANNLAQDIDRSETEMLITQYQDKLTSTDAVIRRLSDSLGMITKNSMLYSPIDQAKAAAQSLGEIKSEILKQDVILNVMIQRYGEEDPAVTQQKELLNKLRMSLNQMENSPGFIADVSLRNSPSVAIPYMKTYAELEAMMKLKAFITPMLEQAKLDKVKDIPSLIMLDKAYPPEKKIKPKRTLLILSGFMSGLLIAIIIIFANYRFRLFRKELQTVV